MNILIFGFGFIGRPLAELCYQHGNNVRAVKRHLTSDDINLPIELDALELNADIFLHEWNNYPTWIVALPPSQSSDYVATIGHLIERAEQCNVQHFIYTSSTSVFGAEIGQFDEMCATQPESENARQMAQIEQRLQAAAIANVDIVRLGGLYSSERHPLLSLLRRGMPITGANQWVNMVHQTRAVQGLFQAAHAPDGLRVRHFVETPHLTKNEFYTREAAKMGVAAPEFAPSATEPTGKQVWSVFDDFGFGR